jgi:serine/threonine protein kinase
VIAQFKRSLKKEKILKPYFEIDFKEVEIIKQIAEGGFGVIYRAKWRETIVAVKILKPELMKEETIKDFLCELIRRVRGDGVSPAPQHRNVPRSIHQVPQPLNHPRVL